MRETEGEREKKTRGTDDIMFQNRVHGMTTQLPRDNDSVRKIYACINFGIIASPYDTW